MQLAALIVFLPTLIGTICSAGLMNKGSEHDHSRLVDASIDILESCYTDRIGTVGIAGPSIDGVVKVITLKDTIIPVTVIDDTSRLVSHEPTNSASRHKLQVFVVTVANSSTLVKTLVHVKNSKWWNHMASFILIDGPELQHECSNAYEILWEAWKMNLLNSKFLCLHRSRGILIYTFNPYTSKAPVPWQQENTYKGINGHIWTLFVQPYREDESRCDAFDFDKTVDIGGYEIRASVEARQYAGPSSKPTILGIAQNITARIICSSLNATWNLLIHTAGNSPLQDKKGNPRGWAAEVINGSVDIGLTMINQQFWSKYECTYPHFPLSVAAMTQYSGYKSQMNKLVSVLDRSSRFCVLFVLVITLLFFRCYVRTPLIASILNLVRIICNAALPRIPEKTAPRIYLAGLLMLVVTIQGIYQGKFASLLTKQERLPIVDTIDDLARSDHTIYGLKQWSSFFNRSAFEGRYVAIPKFNCTSYVLRDGKAACIGVDFRLMSEAENSKLHLSHQSMGYGYAVYLVRPDWPLTDKVNDIYRRVFAGNLINPLFSRDISDTTNNLESVENAGRDERAKPLTLGQLRFAFVFLAIGLGCATITFIVELLIYGTPNTHLQSLISRRIT